MGRLEDARELHHEIWVADKMVVARGVGTWSEVKGSKLAVRRTCGRRVGTEVLLFFHICVAEKNHKGKGLTSSCEIH